MNYRGQIWYSMDTSPVVHWIIAVPAPFHSPTLRMINHLGEIEQQLWTQQEECRKARNQAASLRRELKQLKESGNRVLSGPARHRIMQALAGAIEKELSE
jgi:hypothetical protein